MFTILSKMLKLLNKKFQAQVHIMLKRKLSLTEILRNLLQECFLVCFKNLKLINHLKNLQIQD